MIFYLSKIKFFFVNFLDTEFYFCFGSKKFGDGGLLDGCGQVLWGMGNWNGIQCFAVCAYVSKGICFCLKLFLDKFFLNKFKWQVFPLDVFSRSASNKNLRRYPCSHLVFIKDKQPRNEKTWRCCTRIKKQKSSDKNNKKKKQEKRKSKVVRYYAIQCFPTPLSSAPCKSSSCLSHTKISLAQITAC